jgi:hypothetical protein
MSLVFIDSFDHYVTADIDDKWTTSTSAVISAGNGRNASKSLRLAGTASTVTKTFGSAQASWVIGVAIKVSQLPNANGGFIRFLDAGTAQCALILNTDGTLSVVRSTGTAVTGGDSVLALSTNTTYYIEWKVTIADSISAGSCKVRVNGIDWITVATGQDMKATANATANGLLIRGLSGVTTFDYDDLYVCDGQGSINNDFLGDVMVSVLYPDGAGNLTQWTPSTGANWQNADDAAPDDDTTYNSTAGAGNIDLYTLTDLATTPVSIKGVQWNAQIRKDDASAYVLNRVVRSGSTNYVGSVSIAPNTTYVNYTEVLELDPDTSAAWTYAGVNALEAGIKLVSVV